MSEYVTVSEATKILGVSRPTVYRLIKDGTLPVERRPHLRAIRIKREDAERLAAELAWQAEQPST